MKTLPLIALLHCVFITTNAQKAGSYTQFLKDRVSQDKVMLLPRAEKKEQPPFYAHFEVVDLRPDTARLGFWAENRTRRELVFNKPASQTLQTYLNTIHADASGTQSFLIVLKKLWLYDEKTVNGQMQVSGRSMGRLLFRAEAFLKTDHGWLPYTYIDTTIHSKGSVMRTANYELPRALTALTDKIAATDETAARKRTRLYSYQQLDSLNNIKFAYAMDTATVLKEGVYANITEFRNNAPSIFNYEIAPDGHGVPQLYLKDEKGNSYYSRKVFGYCDGKQAYVMMDGNFFPILFIDHAVYVWGSKEYKRKNHSVPVIIPLPGLMMAGMMTVAQDAVRMMRFFNLDVYSGEIY